MKNHTTTAMLLTVGAIMAFVSCTNIADIDILDIGSEQRTWKQELSDIISENAQVLQNSGLTLKSYRNLGNATFDASEFFEESTGQYPVYTGSLDKFTLMPYSFVAEDTVTMHFKMDHLKKHVAETLADRHYTAVLLTWEKDGQTLQTTALFNTETGELEYDNILFNLITAEVRSSEDAPRLLTAAEGGNINGSQFESICCYNSAGTAVAGVTLTWQEHGYWKLNDIFSVSDSTKVIGVRYEYVHQSVDHHFEHWSGINPGSYSEITTFYDFIDYSTQYYGMYKYILWAGYWDMRPTSLDDYTLSPGQTYNFPEGRQTGFIKMLMYAPTRPDLYYN